MPASATASLTPRGQFRPLAAFSVFRETPALAQAQEPAVSPADTAARSPPRSRHRPRPRLAAGTPGCSSVLPWCRWQLLGISFSLPDSRLTLRTHFASSFIWIPLRCQCRPRPGRHAGASLLAALLWSTSGAFTKVLTLETPLHLNSPGHRCPFDRLPRVFFAGAGARAVRCGAAT